MFNTKDSCLTGCCKFQCNMVWSLQDDCSIFLRLVRETLVYDVLISGRGWNGCK